MKVCGLARPRLVGLGYPLTGYSSDERDSTLLGVSAVSGKPEHTTFFDRPTGVDNQERVVNLVHGTGDRDQLITSARGGQSEGTESARTPHREAADPACETLQMAAARPDRR